MLRAVCGLLPCKQRSSCRRRRRSSTVFLHQAYRALPTLLHHHHHQHQPRTRLHLTATIRLLTLRAHTRNLPCASSCPYSPRSGFEHFVFRIKLSWVPTDSNISHTCGVLLPSDSRHTRYNCLLLQALRQRIGYNSATPRRRLARLSSMSSMLTCSRLVLADFTTIVTTAGLYTDGLVHQGPALLRLAQSFRSQAFLDTDKRVDTPIDCPSRPALSAPSSISFRSGWHA